MRVENIKIPNTEVLIATVLYWTPNDFTKAKTDFVTDESKSIQVGVLHRPEGTQVKAHQHLPVQKTVSGCQEVLIIKTGVVLVSIFDQLQNHLQDITLRAGDIFIQYHGGHSFDFKVDTQFVEIKQGPFTPADKVFFDPRCHESMK